MHFPVKKSLSLSLALCYFFTQIAFAQKAESNFWEERRRHARETDAGGAQFASLPRAMADIPSAAPLMPAAFSAQAAADIPVLKNLPAAYGSLRKITQPRSSGGRVVVHIQDVHRNAEAQRNIAAALTALIDQQAVDLVALEGTSEELDVARARAFPHKAVIREAADVLLRDHMITGPAHAALTHSGAIPPFAGVEDAAHYQANIDAYRRSAPVRDSARRELDGLGRALAAEKQKMYSPELLALDRLTQDHREGKLSLADFARSLAARVPPAEVPRAVRDFVRAAEIEAALDFKQVESERARLLERLTRALSKAQLDALVQASVDYRLGRATFGEFHRRLEKICDASGVPLARFPAMARYVRYVLLSDGIDAEALLAGAAALETRAFESAARTPAQKRLLREAKTFALRERLVDFSLTPAEWSEYKNTAAAAGRAAIDLAAFEDFYRESEARDRAFARNILAAMDLRGAKTAVLVAGGFHGAGVAAALEESGVTVAAYVPKIEKIEAAGGAAYLSVFTQERTPLEKLFAGDKLFLGENPLAPSVARLQLGKLALAILELADPRRRNPDAAAQFDFLSGDERLRGASKDLKSGRAEIRIQGPRGDVKESFWRDAGGLRGGPQTAAANLMTWRAPATASIFDEDLREGGFHRSHPALYVLYTIFGVVWEGVVQAPIPLVMAGLGFQTPAAFWVGILEAALLAPVFAGLHFKSGRRAFFLALLGRGESWRSPQILRTLPAGPHALAKMAILTVIGFSLGLVYPFAIQSGYTWQQAALMSLALHPIINALILILKKFGLLPPWFPVASFVDEQFPGREDLGGIYTLLSEAIAAGDVDLVETHLEALSRGWSPPEQLLVLGVLIEKHPVSGFSNKEAVHPVLEAFIPALGGMSAEIPAEVRPILLDQIRRWIRANDSGLREDAFQSAMRTFQAVRKRTLPRVVQWDRATVIEHFREARLFGDEFELPTLESRARALPAEDAVDVLTGIADCGFPGLEARAFNGLLDILETRPEMLAARRIRLECLIREKLLVYQGLERVKALFDRVDLRMLRLTNVLPAGQDGAGLDDVIRHLSEMREALAFWDGAPETNPSRGSFIFIDERQDILFQHASLWPRAFRPWGRQLTGAVYAANRLTEEVEHAWMPQKFGAARFFLKQVVSHLTFAGQAPSTAAPPLSDEYRALEDRLADIFSDENKASQLPDLIAEAVRLKAARESVDILSSAMALTSGEVARTAFFALLKVAFERPEEINEESLLRLESAGSEWLDRREANPDEIAAFRTLLAKGVKAVKVAHGQEISGASGGIDGLLTLPATYQAGIKFFGFFGWKNPPRWAIEIVFASIYELAWLFRPVSFLFAHDNKNVKQFAVRAAGVLAMYGTFFGLMPAAWAATFFKVMVVSEILRFASKISKPFPFLARVTFLVFLVMALGQVPAAAAFSPITPVDASGVLNAVLGFAGVHGAYNAVNALVRRFTGRSAALTVPDAAEERERLIKVIEQSAVPTDRSQYANDEDYKIALWRRFIGYYEAVLDLLSLGGVFEDGTIIAPGSGVDAIMGRAAPTVAIDKWNLEHAARSLKKRKTGDTELAAPDRYRFLQRDADPDLFPAIVDPHVKTGRRVVLLKALAGHVVKPPEFEPMAAYLDKLDKYLKPGDRIVILDRVDAARSGDWFARSGWRALDFGLSPRQVERVTAAMKTIHFGEKNREQATLLWDEYMLSTFFNVPSYLAVYEKPFPPAGGGSAGVLDALLEGGNAAAGRLSDVFPDIRDRQLNEMDARGVIVDRFVPAVAENLKNDAEFRAEFFRNLKSRPSGGQVVSALVGTEQKKTQVALFAVGRGEEEKARRMAALAKEISEDGLQLVLAARDKGVLDEIQSLHGGSVHVLEDFVAPDGALDPETLGAHFEFLARQFNWSEETTRVTFSMSPDIVLGNALEGIQNPLLKKALDDFLSLPIAPVRLQQMLEIAALIAKYA